MLKRITRLAQIIGFIVIFAVIAFFAYRMISASIKRQDYIEEVEQVIPRDELTRESSVALAPERAEEIAYIYEAFLSPHQEGGEEEDTPSFIPDLFKSTEPSVVRNERESRGHSVLEFSSDLSKVYVYLAIENVDPNDINMMHIHCGRPGQLGPILIDFSLIGNIQDYFEDNVLALEIRNEDIVAASEHGEGLVAAFTAGCAISPPVPDRVKTIAGMEYIARQGELYFNVHTYAQTYFGEMRGQFHAFVNN